MRKFRLDLGYCGTEFVGWQSQPCGQTVQDSLQKALSVILGEKTAVLGASRTDSGVHAEHQVATFTSSANFDQQRLPISLNALLPEAISVYSSCAVEDGFHPIVSSKGKIYRYRLWRGRTTSPFAKPYIWQIPQDMDQKVLESVLSGVIGEFDFSSFCASDSSAKTRVRQILDVRVESRGPLTNIWILGNVFLKQMVRSIVGTAVDIALGRQTSSISDILEARRRSAAGVTAPPQGLSLVRIFYEEGASIDKMIQLSDKGFSIGLRP